VIENETEMSGTDADAPTLQSAGRQWLADARRVDLAVYRAVAATPTPALDAAMSRVSHTADKSRLWICGAAVLAIVGGPSGRRAALQGLASVAVTSAVVNLGVKRLGGRGRPDREGAGVPVDRHVRMPTSLSFPSGHSASAFAFATGVGNQLPPIAVPLHGLAAVVAYSRVHTGVHYPGDVVVGSLIGTALAQLTTQTMDRHLRRHGVPRTLRRRGRHSYWDVGPLG
jgi:membrane-associated phospholipid phosphatase